MATVFVYWWAQNGGWSPLSTQEPIWKLPFPVTSVAIRQSSHGFVHGGKGHGRVIAINHKDKIKME